MGNRWKHFRLICKHRHLVIRNASHCGIFWHSLRHDLSKFLPVEFKPSATYFAGNHSPLIEERINNGGFSTASQHHLKHNKHHWEYWTDYFCGHIVAKTMPWKYAIESVCDMISASYVYHPKDFDKESTLLYFKKHCKAAYMTEGTEAFLIWCLERYRDLGFKGLKKKDTKKQYQEIVNKYPMTKLFQAERGLAELPHVR